MTERPNKPESSGLNELRTFEYTSRQLVFAICVFLLLGAGLILLGIQLGQREKYSKLQEQMTKLSNAKNTDKENNVQNVTNEGKGTQLSPLIAPVSPAKPAASKNETRDTEQPKFVEVPAPAHSSTPAKNVGTKTDQFPSDIMKDQSVSAQTVSPSPEAAASQAIPAGSEPTATASEHSPSISQAETTTVASNQVGAKETKPLEPMSDVADDRPEDSRQEAIPASTNVKKANGKALYAIQVAAIPSSRRREAEEYIKKLNDLNPYIRESEDKKFLRVLVGEYPDRQTAEKKMLELKKKKEFSGCFIRKL
ncbi:MAG TPA: SPOR domain-containing protein [Candidatus Hydrogenedentes bacterium]|nr:SPOR domain-containing protein [Candidatus Hydrogenedentota bacterium]HOL75758.1 SPOR domain-containing protein [Candidatus Hydrogenedentota bacterium]HPO84249.1 SPOR domain-containing protein [Candidatus Hydrogenedentota bacterium]